MSRGIAGAPDRCSGSNAGLAQGESPTIQCHNPNWYRGQRTGAYRTTATLTSDASLPDQYPQAGASAFDTVNKNVNRQRPAGFTDGHVRIDVEAE